MKILAIEQETEGVDWKSVDEELLKLEAAAIYRMYLTEELREHYFNEHKCAVLVLECADIEQVRERLAKLPLMENSLIYFELMELHPYTGYERLMV